ncbi:MAG: hypothetical protein HQL69_19025 [Magnetococcales bacterium]|nr:hypothetical protein [Magnetococcales bacterium]
MVNSVPQSNAYSQQTSAVSQALKQAKPDVGPKQANSQGSGNSSSSYSGNRGFKPPPQGIDVSA